MTNTNLEKGIPWRFGPDWPGQRYQGKGTLIVLGSLSMSACLDINPDQNSYL